MPSSNKLRYLLWAGTRFINADTSCPACSEVQTVPLRRKYGVTALYRCTSCEVMFRVPKASQKEDVQFYQRDYEQGFTTDCPTPDELTRLKRCCFAGTERDYSSYVEVLRAARLDPGSVIYDFGCSCGYGSWQLRHAGYRVYSFEVSRPRARYAVENLQCELCTPDELPEKVDCFFAAHVIEHLSNPRVLWELALNVNKPARLRPIPYAVFLHGIEVWKPIVGRRREALLGASLLLVNSATTVKEARVFNPWCRKRKLHGLASSGKMKLRASDLILRSASLSAGWPILSASRAMTL
jgi:Zn ribbon nucleic-acid-binding protein